MKKLLVTFLVLFAFEIRPSEARNINNNPESTAGYAAKTNSLSTVNPTVNPKRIPGPPPNIGTIANSLESINNVLYRMDRSLSDLVETKQELPKNLALLVVEAMNDMMDKSLSCNRALGEPPTNARPYFNAAGDRVTIKCNEGFMTESQAIEQTIECHEGRWSNYKPCKKVCPEPFYVEGDLCLHFVLEGHTWIKAKENCAQMGPESTLAMLSTASEARSFKDFLVNKNVSAPTGYVWLGATEDTQDRGNWFWLDESPVVFNDELDWKKGEPNEDKYSYREDCLDFNLDAKGLNDDNCAHELSSVCEIPALDFGFVQYTSSIHA